MYVWRAGELRAVESPYPEAEEATRAELAAAASAAGARRRVAGGRYGLCQEGAFFHAGLSPTPAAPDCAAGTWALLDDIGRFSGQLRVLRGGRCESRRGRPNGTR